MTSVLWKDLKREILRSKGRFLSILLIVTLGVSFYTGVASTPEIMRYSVDQYYNENHMMDLKVHSFTGFREIDQKNISEISEVEDSYLSKYIDCVVENNHASYTIRVHSLDPDSQSMMNRPVIKQGRLPENLDECVVEDLMMKRFGWNLGDEIQIPTQYAQGLKQQTFRIVGSIQYPYYLSMDKGSTKVGKGRIESYIMIKDDVFESAYMSELFISTKTENKPLSYSKEYQDYLQPIKDQMQNLSNTSLHNQEQQLSNITSNLTNHVAPQWIILDRMQHLPFADYLSAADRMEGIAKVFPIFFFLVAALVCLTTTTRMVDEQRISIGTMKALGYSNSSIAMKFVLYVGIATLLGSIIGSVLGYLFFPNIICQAWSMMYHMNDIYYYIQPNIILQAVGTILFVCITISAYTVYKTLTETPAALLRGKLIQAGKKLWIEQCSFIWKPLSFTMKVTIRNLFRYKKRLFMTVLGVSGCSALLIAGFGMKDSISDVARKQFEELFRYNMSAQVMSNLVNLEQIEEDVQQIQGVEDVIAIYQQNVTLTKDENEKLVSLIGIDDAKHFANFVTLRNGTQPILIPFDGIVVTKKLADAFQLQINDTMDLQLQDQQFTVTIKGITENYMGHYIYADAQYLNSLINQKKQANTLFIKVTQEETIQQAVIEKLNANTMLSNVVNYSSIADNFSKIVSSLNVIVFVLVISAALLAFVVLYNLSTVNISERMKEIATIKVLGFYDKEVIQYVYREIMILTIIGALLGFLFGIVLHDMIMDLAEMDQMMFTRDIYVSSYIISFLLTIIFSFIINRFMYPKLKNIAMVESLKSVE